MHLDLNIVCEPDGTGGWIAEILEIDGAFSVGATKEEARANAFDAARELLAFRSERAAREHTDAPRETVALVA